mgnify:CR=1 FL=1
MSKNKTWFLDIDGTMLKHRNNIQIGDSQDAGTSGTEDDGEQILPYVNEFLDTIPETDQIVLTTARKVEHREITEKALERFDILKRVESIVYDVKWYGSDTTVKVPGVGTKPLAHIDVLPNSAKFMDSSYETEGLTGYFLETNYSKVSLNIGESASSIPESRLLIGSSGFKSAVKIEDVVIPNRFLHIIIDDFLHMPIDTGTTGDG